jgi:hypothetical protein
VIHFFGKGALLLDGCVDIGNFIEADPEREAAGQPYQILASGETGEVLGDGLEGLQRIYDAVGGNEIGFGLRGADEID